MAVSRALLGTGGVESGRIVRDVLPDLARLEPDYNLLTLLLSQADDDVRKVTAPTFYHWEHQPLRRATQVNNGAGYASDATSIAVDDGSGAYINSLWRNMNTQEIFKVTAVSTNTWTIERGHSDTTPAAMTDNDHLLRIGTAKAEGGTVGDPLHQEYTSDTNYIQKFENAWGVNDILDMTKLETGDEYRNRKREAFFEHMIDLELALIWGEKSVANPTSQTPTYTTRGFMSFVSTNDFDVAGSLTEQELNFDILPDVFRYGSKRKILMGGSNIQAIFSMWNNDKIQTSPGLSKMLGSEVKEYVSPFGRLAIMYHRLFDEADMTGTDAFQNMGIIVDPANIRLARMRPTKVWENIQANDAYSRKGAVVSYLGLDMRLEKTHAILRNVTN